jgi:hypothetical protein
VVGVGIVFIIIIGGLVKVLLLFLVSSSARFRSCFLSTQEGRTHKYQKHSEF